jgi:hypothetical protein
MPFRDHPFLAYLRALISPVFPVRPATWVKGRWYACSNCGFVTRATDHPIRYERGVCAGCDAQMDLLRGDRHE